MPIQTLIEEDGWIIIFMELFFHITTIEKALNLTVGGGANQYIGGHYGEVVWAQYASNGKIRHRYYDDDATKNDVNFYAKLDYKIGEKLNCFSGSTATHDSI